MGTVKRRNRGMKRQWIRDAYDDPDEFMVMVVVVEIAKKHDDWDAEEIIDAAYCRATRQHNVWYYDPLQYGYCKRYMGLDRGVPTFKWERM